MNLRTLRAAWWAWRTLPRVRRQLRAGRLRNLSVGAPPTLPPDSQRGVDAVLRRLPSSCLERAVVLQRWHAAQGRPLDVIVGVTGLDDFKAHAWLEGEPVPLLPRFNELFRLSA
jgi:hypothetical protein